VNVGKVITRAVAPMVYVINGAVVDRAVSPLVIV